MARELTAMLIKRLIIQFYLLLVVTIALSGFIIDHFLQQELKNTENSKPHLGSLLYAEKVLYSNPPGNWHAALKKVSQELAVNIELLESNDFDSATQQKLTNQEVVRLELTDKDILLKKLPHSEHIIFMQIDIPEESGRFWIIAFYLLIAVPIILWFLPLAFELKKLADASKAIGKSEFSHRISINPRSAIRSISNTFNEMTERIEYLVEEQKALTNAVSHEIRTPLARLKFALELQRKNHTDTKVLNQLSDMNQDVKELSQLVDEMLNYAKLDKIETTIELQKVHAKSWLSSVVDDSRKNNSKINIDINCEADIINIDPHLMARALNNLILNSFRYANKNIKVELISIKNNIELSISDDGIGILDNQQSKIFEPFSKIDREQDETKQGHGLGLAIVKRIVNKHQGEIKVKNLKPNGAKFVLTIPN